MLRDCQCCIVRDHIVRETKGIGAILGNRTGAGAMPPDVGFQDRYFCRSKNCPCFLELDHTRYAALSLHFAH